MATEIYDLVLKGGRVVDPASGLDGVMDVAVKDGRIAAVLPEILPTAAKSVTDCRGRLVLPGLIDTHAHVYTYVSGRFGLPADMVGVQSGVTTLVDQGGPSCMTFPGFREFIAKPAKSQRASPSSPPMSWAGWRGTTTPRSTGPSRVDVAPR